jgi:hypothetical protein
MDIDMYGNTDQKPVASRQDSDTSSSYKWFKSHAYSSVTNSEIRPHE